MSHRRQQIASVIHRAVQNVFTRGLSDPRVRGMITVTEVEISGDLREATVHISVLPAEHQATTMQGLTAATMRIQRLINEQIDMRRPPHIRLRLDERGKKQAQLLSAIREAVQDDAVPPTHGVDHIREEFEQIARPTSPANAPGEPNS